MPLSAIIDTNALVAGLITNNPRSASAALIDALLAGRFTHFASKESLAEAKDVLRILGGRDYHPFTEEQIDRFCLGLELNSSVLQPTVAISPAIPRDRTDAKWLALAMQSDADYLVTNDRRHLLRLRRIGRTQIVTPAAFQRELDRVTGD
ncbi:MAG: putative toxin-antitoxin system toxin component, PIN family [Pirellulales bacterium]